MARFESAVKIVMDHEGGFVDDPVDPGGATNFGISLRFLRGLDDYLEWDLDFDGDVDADDIRLLRREDAKAIYKRQFWDRYNVGQIRPQMVADKLFDLSVNMGSPQASKIAQRAILALGGALSVDGVVGPITRAKIWESWPKVRAWDYRSRVEANTPGLVAAMRAEAAAFYRSLILLKPKFRKYEDGWMRRAWS